MANSLSLLSPPPPLLSFFLSFSLSSAVEKNASAVKIFWYHLPFQFFPHFSGLNGRERKKERGEGGKERGRKKERGEEEKPVPGVTWSLLGCKYQQQFLLPAREEMFKRERGGEPSCGQLFPLCFSSSSLSPSG